MATPQAPLIFFAPVPGADVLATAESLAAGSPSVRVAPLDTNRLLQKLNSRHGFARMKIAMPEFSLDKPRDQAVVEGVARERHIAVRFYGNFDKIAKPLFDTLTGDGLVCYSVWDKKLITSWPAWDELRIDKGFAGRMTRVMERQTAKLREMESDANERTKMLNAFLKSPEFRVEMAKEARLDKPGAEHRKKTYSDRVNCYARWASGHPSAAELAAVRRLEPEYADMGIAELRNLIGDSPRLLLRTGAHPGRAGALKAAGEGLGLTVDLDHI